MEIEYLFNQLAHSDGDSKSWVSEKWDRFMSWRQQGADRWLAAAYGDESASMQIAHDLAMGFSGTTSVGGASGRIAGGHAMDKHVLGVGARADDPLFRGLGIRTVAQLEAHTANVMANATARRALSNGRTAYWHEPTSTVVIHNPRHVDMGSVFQPSRGRAYFDALR